MSKPDDRRNYAFRPDLSSKGSLVYHVTGGDIPDMGFLVALAASVPSGAIYAWLDASVDNRLRESDGSAA